MACETQREVRTQRLAKRFPAMADLHVILDGAAAIYVADELPGAGETVDLEDGVRAWVADVDIGEDGEPLIWGRRRLD